MIQPTLGLLFSVVCVLLGVTGVTGDASHLYPVFRDLHGLKQQSTSMDSTGRRLVQIEEEHEFTHEAEDTNVHVSYSAVHNPRHTLALLDANTAEDIVKIDCAGPKVIVYCASPDAAQALFDRAVVGELMSGACIQDTTQTKPRPIYGAIKEVKLSTSNTRVLELEISHASFQELFQDIDLTFKWSPPHRDPTEPSMSRRDAQAMRSRPPPSHDTVNPTERGGRKLLYLDKIGDFANSLGETVTDWVDDLVDQTHEIWGSISDAVKDAMAGDDAEVHESLNIVKINYDNANGGAINKSMAFYHAPWLVCTDCYANMELYLDSHIAFQATGLPQIFAIEVGGHFDVKMYVEANGVDFPVANEMSNWHNLAPRVHIFDFTFYVGSVPVVMTIEAELNGGVSVDEAVDDAYFSAGAQITADASMGAHWSWDDSWNYDMSSGWDVNYWLPKWDFDPDHSDVKTQAVLSPAVIVTLWDTVPFVVKPKPYVNVKLGEIAKDSDPALAACATGEAYATTYGMDMGIGIEDITAPTDVPVLGGLTLVDGVDFGILEVLPSSPIPGCGPLCGGCLSQYKAHRKEYEAIALANLGLGPSTGMSGWAVFGWIVFTLFLISLVAFGVWVFMFGGRQKITSYMEFKRQGGALSTLQEPLYV